MKYATEVLDLMAAAPGRPWRMAELVRGASGARELTRRERNAMRQAILRVLETLHEGGQVARIEHCLLYTSALNDKIAGFSHPQLFLSQTMQIADQLSQLNALSPLDGRYASRGDALRGLLSEAGFMAHRVEVEVAWLVALSDACLLYTSDRRTHGRLENGC